jgi:hypothetical protein
MVSRVGMSRLGCLIPLLIVSVAAYFALPAAEAYFDFYRFKDAMGNEARFASTQSDEHIRIRLVALADSLHMPPGAERIMIDRSTSTITISSDYELVIKLPLKKEHVLRFNPTVRSRL